MLIDGVIGLLKGELNGTAQSAYTAQIAAVIAANGVDPSTPSVHGSAVFENELPRGYTLPAVAVHAYGGDQGYDMAGPDSISESQVQIDVYGPDSVSCRILATAVRQLLKAYVGTLPDGTLVPGFFQERDMAMPFVGKADQKGIANRWTIGFRVVSNQM